MSNTLITIILIVIGSIFFPAMGYYLDYRDKKKKQQRRVARTSSKLPS